MIPPSPKASAGLVANATSLVMFLALVVAVVGGLEITRPGYSVDEEFTVFAVRGIRQHGLPLLPSGLLYDRGVAYSYAAWLAGAISGSELPAFRAIGLIAAAVSVFLTFILVRRMANEMAAMTASVLVALSVSFWATATSARFYAPFLAVYLLALILLTHRHWWIPLIAVAALARLTHELAFTLAAIPAMCWLVANGDRRHWFKMTMAVVSGLVMGQLILFALHALEPSSGETMVRRFFLWQVLNLFERPGDRQFGIPLVVMVIGLIVAPKRAWPAVMALSIATMVLAFSIARATNTAPLSLALVSSVLVEGSRYPLDMFWHIVRTTPIAVGVALVTLACRALKTEWPPLHRAAHALWIGWVLWFGVIESGITTNYLLLPVSFMLIAIAIDIHTIARGAGTLVRGAGTLVPAIAGVLIVAAIGLDQWRGEGSPGARLEAARATINVAGIADIRAGLQPNDRVVCTDELGCLMLVGRIDRWLALDDYVRERFLVRRGADVVTGVYTGVPAVFRPAELFSPNADGTLPDRVIVVDIFKEYPIGNSRSWLPKALDDDGVTVRPLLETPQARVLEVSPPEAVARLR